MQVRAAEKYGLTSSPLPATIIRRASAQDIFPISIIYTLEWTPESLIWKINGVEVMRQTIRRAAGGYVHQPGRRR
ncbi:MAG: hypothetical protein MZV63_71070 [Marinilabiliales bacterium]|nr:hypothetical protein [Marinilabiliales bacterium]